MTAVDITAGVPPAIVAAVDAYASVRQPPSMFVKALLADDLTDALAYAPKGMTLEELRATVRYIVNRVPGRARNSANAVDAWLSGATKTPPWGATP